MSKVTGPGVPPMMADPRALCRDADPDVFHPDRYTRASTAEARKVCGQCTLRYRCLEWALENEPTGFWGNHTPVERAAMGGVYKGAAAVAVAA